MTISSRRGLLRLGLGVGAAAACPPLLGDAAAQMAFHLTTLEAGLMLRFEAEVPAAVIDAVDEGGRVVWRGAAKGPTVKHFRLRPGRHAVAIGGFAGEALLNGGAYGLLWLGMRPEGLAIVRRAGNIRAEDLAANKIFTFPPGVRPAEDGSQPVNLMSMGAGVGLVVRLA